MRSARESRTRLPGHMTFAATSVGRTLTRTSEILKRELWIWPIIAIVLLAIIGFGIKTAIERTMKHNLTSQLQTLLSVEESMLLTWLNVQEANAQSLANDQQVRETIVQMLATTDPGSKTAKAAAPVPTATDSPNLAAVLAHELGPGMSSHHFVGYVVVDKRQKVIASSSPELVGSTIPQYETFLSKTLEGTTTTSPPFRSVALVKDEMGRMQTGTPTMFTCAPIRDTNFQVVGAIALRLRPERDFSQIFELGRIGDSGETYAFGKDGLMLSNSRFENDLILLGLMPDSENTHSMLNVSLRDPGVNLLRGYRPSVRRNELPLTKMCEAAIAGNPGVDLAGYNDYRGVPVVGAWKWLPKYEIGLVTELDFDEAFRPLSILRYTFFSLFGLLAASAVAIFVFTVKMARLRKEAQKATIAARQLGQYRLEEIIGEGGMGVVYRGHHAMLRRPTAIKMLTVEKVNETSIARFEQEVQITCKLNHPNTVAIYDYGRTPEGVFYYAMELLDGINLQSLVEKYGPQSEGRVIAILRQVCGSLFEAHSLGLVHRDIKPANIMLNRRGGEPDVAKVLDFGLVKAINDDKNARRSEGGASGTPLYMSPEAIQTPDSVDARSDLYAVGAVGYFLLTAQPVFTATSLVELCQQHLTAVPQSLSERLGQPISPELEAALLACLDKNRARRPQTARDLSQLLSRVPTAGSWSLDEAEAWWGRHERAQAGQANAASAAAGPAVRSGTPSAAPASYAASAPTSPGLEHTIAFPPRSDL
ncbi:MAG: serine/threonine protein kinase [Planctomycetales bacterium]|nr:serine/threonine protein kinase [Planctomycetales bacterium]